MASPVETVLARLPAGSYRCSGSGWSALCPAHSDTSRSLKISNGDKGGVLLHCFTGCSFESIIGALNLTVQDVMPETPKKPSVKKTDWTARAAHYASQFTDKGKADLCAMLQLPLSALEGLPAIGMWTLEDEPSLTPGWTFPEFNDTGSITGIARRFADHTKGFFVDGGRGVYPSTDWCTRPGALYLVEGPTDVLACYAAGLAAIGRPSNIGGIELLARFLREVPGARPLIVVGENDRKPDGSWPGREGAERTASRLGTILKRRVLVAYPPDDAKDVRVWLTTRVAAGATWDKVGEEFAARLVFSEVSGRVPIVINTDEYSVNTNVMQALACDHELYVRAGQIVRILHEEKKENKQRECQFPAGPRIVPLSNHTLREHISRRVDFLTIKKHGEVSVHPPEWCVNSVKDRGIWPNLRGLELVVDYPVLRSDGSILLTPGYDPQTEIFYRPEGEPPAIAPHLTKDAAVKGWKELQEAITDFPMRHDMYRSAWLAAVLTPLARFAFRGPAPLFLVDGNIRGAGKGLLCDTVSLIVTGREFATTGFTNDDEEMRKRITAIAVEGDRMVLLDNITGNFSGSSLDRALTSTLWKDRLLSQNTQVEAPLWATWYGTGNNVQVEGDTARRICHIRIETDAEHPEERKNFKYANLRSWVLANRPRLLGAALTILGAFAQAGFPQADMCPWGSYESWSSVVRAAVVWLGLPDPGETRSEMRQRSDSTSSAMAMLVEHWEELDTAGTGLTTAQIITKLFPKFGQTPENLIDVAAAVETILPRLTGGLLGYKFRHYRRRNFSGRYLDQDGTRSHAIRWRVFHVDTQTPVTKSRSKHAGEDGGDGEVIPPAELENFSGDKNRKEKKIFPRLGEKSSPSTPSSPDFTRNRLKTDDDTTFEDFNS